MIVISGTKNLDFFNNDNFNPWNNDCDPNFLNTMILSLKIWSLIKKILILDPFNNVTFDPQTLVIPISRIHWSRMAVALIPMIHRITLVHDITILIPFILIIFIDNIWIE